MTSPLPLPSVQTTGTLTGSVAIYAVVRILIPSVAGATPEELILSALRKADLVNATNGFTSDIVKYEVTVRRPGGAENEEPLVYLDADHLELLDLEADAEVFDIRASQHQTVALLPVQYTEEILPESFLN